MQPLDQTQHNAVGFESVSVTLGGHTILDQISARVPIQSSTAIVGPNGAGKTTLLLALLGELSYMGRIQFAKPPQNRNFRIGYVPQRLPFDRGVPLTVEEFMVMGWQRMPLFFGIRKSHRDRARHLLSSVKAEHALHQRIGTLSGGEMQRVLLAVALGQDPDLLVLDEPTAGVDFQGEHLFCELLERLRTEHGFTQLMVSHDLATVTHHANHVICLNRHVAAEGPPKQVLTPETLSATFGLHMGLVARQALPNGKCSCSSSCCMKGTEHA